MLYTAKIFIGFRGRKRNAKLSHKCFLKTVSTFLKYFTNIQWLLFLLPLKLVYWEHRCFESPGHSALTQGHLNICYESSS